jgi:hypothetical protein
MRRNAAHIKRIFSKMKLTQIVFRTVALSLLLMGVVAEAQITGTVTDKTTGKPAVGDTVVLVDVQTGMGEVAKTTTDAGGHYKLTKPGHSNYLVRAIHQGAPYFIGAPEGNAPGDISVYDVTAKVPGVFVEADVLEFEAANGQLQVTERYFVHNPSQPPTTQWSKQSFQIVLPKEAVVEGAGAQRPGGLPTSINLDADGPKGQYAFNFPIQPDDGDKSTLFEISYHVPYSGGTFTFKPQVLLPTQSIGVLLPKSMTFSSKSGLAFKSVPQDPTIQTFVAKNAVPGKEVEFTISGTGSIPREEQGAQAGQQPEAGAPGSGPGGGLGAPIATPDPLTKYKWYIVTLVILLMAAAAAFLLRKPVPAPGFEGGTVQAFAPLPTDKSAALLNALKDELFAVESEKIAGTLAPAEYAEVKAALETVLRRALKRK